MSQATTEPTVDAAAQETPRPADTAWIEVEIVDVAKYLRPDGSALPHDEAVRLHLQSREPSGFSYADGGVALEYPRLGLTDDERADFLSGLGPAIASLYEDQPTGAQQ